MTDDKTTTASKTIGSNAPDYEALARQYLDLWQDQFAAMAADPGTMETMSKMTSAWREATLSFLQGSGPASPFGDLATSFENKGPAHDASGSDTSNDSTATAARATAFDGASGGANGDVDALLRRVAELETRLAALEHNAGPIKKPKKKPRARKSVK